MSKLVRDKIPEIIRNKGGRAITHVADKEEYWKKLKEKLEEEVEEFLRDSNEEELADILEVLYAICDFKKIDKKKLELIRKKKARERGKFKHKLILDKVSIGNPNEMKVIPHEVPKEI